MNEKQLSFYFANPSYLPQTMQDIVQSQKLTLGTKALCFPDHQFHNFQFISVYENGFCVELFLVTS